MILDVEIRGVVSTIGEKGGVYDGVQVVKYQMRKERMVKTERQPLGEPIWIEWEDIPIVKEGE